MLSQVPELDHERSLLLPAVFASRPTFYITNIADGKLMLLNFVSNCIYKKFVRTHNVPIRNMQQQQFTA